MVFGRSGGVRGHGMDHANRFPRTLAGFGLTWHGGSRFSFFGEILETHFITKYLQIGPRASRLVLGFFGRPGHQIKPINVPKNDPKQNSFRELGQLPKIVIFWQNGFLCFAFSLAPVGRALLAATGVLRLAMYWTRHLLVNLEKLGFHAKLDFLTPYGNWGRFDKTEVCEKMVRKFMGPGSPSFCLTE